MTSEQTQLFDLLKSFSAFCERHNLCYYLAGGTLLGAIRHRGFIPWDDDVDVMMPVEDYEQFLELGSELPVGLTIQTEFTDENYPFFFAKLCDTRKPFTTQNRNGPRGIYIDIFPIAPSRRPTKWTGFLFDIISVMNYVLQVKCGWMGYIPYKQNAARLGYWILDRFTKQRLRNLRRDVIKCLTAKDEGFFLSPGGGHKGTVEFYPKSWFSDTVFLDFEGERFSAPTKWDGYLRQLYGYYMIPPQESDRNTKHKG